MELFSIITTLGLGSLITVGIQHFLDRERQKEARLFDIKREVFGKAIGVISGFGNRTVHFILSNTHNHEVGQIALVDYLTKIDENISSALLFANEDLGEKMRGLNKKAIEVSGIISTLLNGAEKVGDGYIAGKPVEASQLLMKWKKEMDDFEKLIINKMKSELGI